MGSAEPVLAGDFGIIVESVSVGYFRIWGPFTVAFEGGRIHVVDKLRMAVHTYGYWGLGVGVGKGIAAQLELGSINGVMPRDGIEGFGWSLELDGVSGWGGNLSKSISDTGVVSTSAGNGIGWMHGISGLRTYTWYISSANFDDAPILSRPFLRLLNK